MYIATGYEEPFPEDEEIKAKHNLVVSLCGEVDSILFSRGTTPLDPKNPFYGRGIYPATRAVLSSHDYSALPCDLRWRLGYFEEALRINEEGHSEVFTNWSISLKNLLLDREARLRQLSSGDVDPERFTKRDGMDANRKKKISKNLRRLERIVFRGLVTNQKDLSEISFKLDGHLGTEVGDLFYEASSLHLDRLEEVQGAFSDLRTFIASSI